MTDKQWDRLANIATTAGVIGALIFSGLNSWQASQQALQAKQANVLSRQQSLAAQLSQFAELAKDTDLGRQRTQLSPAVAKYTPADAWSDLYKARNIAYQILIHDLFFDAAAADKTLVNRPAIRQISIHLEDAFVRELLAASGIITRSIRAHGVSSDEDPCRIRLMLFSLYLIVHPNATVDRDIPQAINAEKSDHENPSNKDAQHGKRFSEFYQRVEKISPGCPEARAWLQFSSEG